MEPGAAGSASPGAAHAHTDLPAALHDGAGGLDAGAAADTRPPAAAGEAGASNKEVESKVRATVRGAGICAA